MAAKAMDPSISQGRVNLSGGSERSPADVEGRGEGKEGGRGGKELLSFREWEKTGPEI